MLSAISTQYSAKHDELVKSRHPVEKRGLVFL